MKDMLVYHHSAINSPRPQADEIIASHRRNPKIKQPGAYTFVLEHSGLVVQLHPEEYIGHHAGNWKINPRSIGICLAGDFTQTKPTDAQIDALTRLSMDLQMRWGIPDTNIKLHKEVRTNPTACPGVDLRALYFARRTDLLKTRVERLLQAEKRATGQRLARIQRILARLLP